MKPWEVLLPPTVTCCACGKSIKRAAALGVNGRWSCSNKTCLGKAMRTLPSVRDVEHQLGLFSKGGGR